MNYSHSQNAVANSPKLEEWALISKHRALQQQRMKQIEKMQQYNKKMKFKHDLDEQLNNKNNSHLRDQQADQKYYQYIIGKAKEQRQRQSRQKMEKYRRRMQMQEQNKHLLQVSRNSRLIDNQSGYKLDIGIKSQHDQKVREQMGKREMLRALDQQVKQKREKNRQNRIQDYLKDQAHFKKETDIFTHDLPNKSKGKNYQQNQQVYHHYSHLLDQKRRKQQQLEKKYIQEAAKLKGQQQMKRKIYEEHKKEQLTHNMKETLDEQVKIYNYKKKSQKNVNPQDVSFGFIKNVFREHPPAYDKNKYYEQLRRQAQQQKQKKRQLDFMTEEEYRLNRNQLNKIVSGEYAYNKYVDRSLGAIGQKSFSKPILQDENSLLVKSKLANIKNRRDGYFSPMQHSH